MMDVEGFADLAQALMCARRMAIARATVPANVLPISVESMNVETFAANA